MLIALGNDFNFFSIIGVVLVILGILSGVTIFVKAVKGTLGNDSASHGALWAMFMFGILAGLYLLRTGRYISMV